MKKSWLYWTPRILSMIFILFISLFAFDVFEGNSGFWNIALALFMHLIPSFVLVVILIISWKHELVGGIAFILGGLLYIWRVILTAIQNPFEWYLVSWSIIIAGPAFFIGILWILNWKRRKKEKKKH